MRVLIICSVKWAFYWSANCILKHSHHHIDFETPRRISFEKARDYDVIYCLNIDCWKILERQWGRALTKRLTENRKVICGVGSRVTADRLLETLNRVSFHYVRVPSCLIKNYLESKSNLKNIKIMRNAVNPSIFKPPINSNHDFVVGWAGKERIEKRTALLKKLKYPVKFARGIAHKKMPHFYDSLSVYVCASSTEGTPMPILEAMACGLPVVSTRVGIVPEALDEAWIVPVKPESEVVKLMNRKLTTLQEDGRLRKSVGKRNRQEVLRNWTCKKRVKEWDKVFEA